MKNVVVGGGIAGLSAAWRLRDQETLLIEAQDRVGGWIGRLDAAPFPFPLGPRTIRCKEGGALLRLIQEVGLKPLSPPQGLKRYVFWRGQLHELRWTSPLFKGIRLDLLCGLMKILPKQDQSASAFIRNTFSNEVANRLGIPFLRGVFGQNGDNLSIKSAFPWFGRGPLLRHFFGKKSSFLSLKGGIMDLVERLSDRLRYQIFLDEKVIGMEKGKVITNKREITCDRIISTLPSSSLPYVSITQVHCFWEKKLEQVKGFGYLVSPEESGNVLGALFDSEMMAGTKGTAITWMLSGLVEGKEEVIEAMKRQLKIEQVPDFVKVTYAKEAIPSYPIGFLDSKKEYVESVKNWLVSLGTSVSGHSVADVVEGAFAWKL